MEICKCLVCNNLTGDSLALDLKLMEVCKCTKGKFDVSGVKGYYRFDLSKKDIKELTEFSNECQEFDYRMKPKVS